LRAALIFPRQLLTSGAFSARRRLDELPARSSRGHHARPLAEGSAQVNVAMLERPPLFGGKWTWVLRLSMRSPSGRSR
jgi:hypothetical protein